MSERPRIAVRGRRRACSIAYHTTAALLDTALACSCDRADVPLCAQCECLFLLVEAVVAWGTGRPVTAAYRAH